MKTEIDKQIIEAAQAKGFAVAEGATIIIKDPVTSAMASLCFGQNDFRSAKAMLVKMGLIIGEATEVKPEPVVVKSGFYVEATSPKKTWWNVLDSTGEIVSEKRLRRADAEELAEKLNNSAN